MAEPALNANIRGENMEHGLGEVRRTRNHLMPGQELLACKQVSDWLSSLEHRVLLIEDVRMMLENGHPAG